LAQATLLDVDPAPPEKGTQHPTFWPMYCGQTAGWIKIPLGTEVGLGPGHIVLDGDPASPPQKKKGYCTALHPQILGQCLLWPMAGWIKMPLDMEVGFSSGHIVLDGDPAPPKGHSPQFSAHVCCGQTAGCIKMPHGMEVGLSPGNILLDA